MKQRPADTGSGPHAHPFSGDPSQLYIRWDSGHEVRKYQEGCVPSQLLHHRSLIMALSQGLLLEGTRRENGGLW